MNRIYFIREANDLTQEKFANLFNIDRSLVSKWENEECIPSIEKINLISNYFNLSFDYIFNFSSCRNTIIIRKELDKKIVGERLRYIRNKNKMTLQKFSKKLNTTSSTISAYENGKTMLLTSFALQICIDYHVSMDWLYGKID